MIEVLENPVMREWATPLSLEQYHILVESGAISQNLEFIEGALIEKMPKSPLHVYMIETIRDFFTGLLSESVSVRSEQPITIDNSEPEPDISVVKGKKIDYVNNHPTSAEIIIEISNSTLALDKSKANLYAKANVKEFIIFDIKNNEAWFYCDNQNGKYQSVKRYLKNETFVLKQFHGVEISLDTFLPKKSGLVS